MIHLHFKFKLISFPLHVMEAYDANGMIEFNEPVPFRLTRNMQTFFSQFGVEGLIVSAICAAAQSIISPKVALVSSSQCFEYLYCGKYVMEFAYFTSTL